MHVAQQLTAWNAASPVGPALLEPIQERLVGQLAHHDQLAVDDFESLERQDERMPQRLDPIQRLDFLVGLALAEAPVDELDRFEQPTGRLGLPDLAKAAGSQSLD